MRKRPRRDIYEIARFLTEDPDVVGKKTKRRKKRRERKLPNSLVGPDVAGGIAGRIIGELEKIGCSLEDYEIEWMGNGFKINIWDIECNSPEGASEIRRRLKKDYPESGWDMGRYPGRYAYAAIANVIQKFAQQEFNVVVHHSGFKDSDTVELVIMPSKEPLEPETDEEEMAQDGLGAAPALGPGEGGLEAGAGLEDVTLGLDDLEGIEGLGGDEEEGMPPEEEEEESLF